METAEVFASARNDYAYFMTKERQNALCAHHACASICPSIYDAISASNLMDSFLNMDMKDYHLSLTDNLQYSAIITHDKGHFTYYQVLSRVYHKLLIKFC
jgi:hypothetical protein